MGLQYTNRRGDVYYLQSTTRKDGKLAYSFTRKIKGTPVDEMPEGYEAYEMPQTAGVVLRKIVPSAILVQEKQAVEQAIRLHTNVSHSIVEVDGNALVVWTPESDDEAERMSEYLHVPLERMKAHLLRTAHYTKMMRFELNNPQTRSFDAYRWCFLGGIENWISLAYDKPLPALLKRYIPHLDKQTFFDLGAQIR